MISFQYYIQKNFLDKEVIVDCSDIRQYKGKLIKLYADAIALLPYKKSTPMLIPISNILMIQEAEK